MSIETNPYNHYKEWCDHCQVTMIICGKCKNNCCNGGNGEIDDIECDACNSAYEMQDEMYKIEGEKVYDSKYASSSPRI